MLILHRRATVGQPLVSLSIAIAILIIVSQCGASAQPGRPSDTQPSRQEILWELAQTQRMLADEEFVAGDHDEAKADYLKEEATLRQLNTRSGFLTDANIRLINDELKYRKLLLERRKSFWGLRFAARPVNPVAALNQFEATYGRFKDLVNEVSVLADKLKNGGKSEYKLEDEQLQSERDQRVAELQQNIAAVRLRDADVRRKMYEDRKVAIQSRQTAIASEISSLQKQVSQRSAAMTATLTSALTQAIGLPPDTIKLVSGAAKNDYSAVLKAAVQKYANSGDAALGFSGHLKKLAATAHEAARDYEKVRQTITDVRERANQGAALLKALQSNARDQLITVGREVMIQLSPTARTQILAGLPKITDLDSALRLAGKKTEVRKQIAAYIDKNAKLSAKIAPILSDYLKFETTAFAVRYQQLLAIEAAAAKTIKEQSILLQILSRGWARTLVHDVLETQGHVVTIATSLGSACASDLDCADWLVDHVRKNGFGGKIVVADEYGGITVTVNRNVVARFSIADLIKITNGRKIENTVTTIQQDVDSILSRINSGKSPTLSSVLQSMPNTDFAQLIVPLLKSALPAERQIELTQILTSSTRAGAPPPVSQDMAALALGGEIAKKTIFTPATKPAEEPAALTGPPAAPLPGVDADPNKNLILSAMKASGPYGYATATAIQLFSGIAQNAVAIEQINAKASEDRDLTVELLHIGGFESDINRDEAIATLEHRIATTQYASAGSRSTLYEQALLDHAGQTTAIQAKIRRRLPLIFLLSEQLREQFDILDHTIGFWENDLSSNNSFLERTIRNDPQFRRLALDPDISLYDWFKRDSEGQRKDLDALLVHWKQVEALVTDLCARLRCSANNSQMGQVEMTSIISIHKLVGSVAWSAAASSHRLLFTILPKSLPNLPHRDGLRLVQISGAVWTKPNSYGVNPNIVLRHSGLGYVSVGGVGFRETLEPSIDLTPKLPIDDDKSSALLTALQGRWSPNPTLLPLEGYPLYGLYSVEFPANFDFETDDLVLRFYYQWPTHTPTRDRQDRSLSFNCIDTGGRHVRVSSSEVALLLQDDVKGHLSIRGANACSLVEVQR